MKNIIVLKNLPSNLVDEAIVILKSNKKVKKKEIIENKNKDKLQEREEENYNFEVKEAENIIQDYIKNLEKPNDNKTSMANLVVKYKKLQISSLFLGITAIIGIIMWIIN